MAKLIELLPGFQFGMLEDEKERIVIKPHQASFVSGAIEIALEGLSEDEYQLQKDMEELVRLIRLNMVPKQG